MSCIPLDLVGTKIRFKTCTPTAAELASCTHYNMTLRQHWNPTTVSRQSTSQSEPRGCPPVRRRISLLDSVMLGNRDWFDYLDPTSDESVLHGIDPSLPLSQESFKPHDRTKVQIQSADTSGDVLAQMTFVSDEQHTKMSIEDLAEKFCISQKQAKATYQVTTQRGMRSAILPISQRYRADHNFLVKRLAGKWSTDTAWSKVKSLRGNVALQIYSHKFGFIQSYHTSWANGKNVGNSLLDFINDYGAPYHLTYDGAAVQVRSKTKFVSALRQYNIRNHVSSPRRPNKNSSKAEIRELKKRYFRLMIKLKVPKRVWDYGFTWVCKTNNVAANFSQFSDGRMPLKIVTGEMPDITEYLVFGFYDWVQFRTNAGLGETGIGRWLSVSHRVGHSMSYWILPSSGQPISCSTVQRLTEAEKRTREWQQCMDQYKDNLEGKFKATLSSVKRSGKELNPANEIDLDGEDEDFIQEYRQVIDNAAIPNADDRGQPHTEGFEVVTERDSYINC